MSEIYIYCRDCRYSLTTEFPPVKNFICDKCKLQDKVQLLEKELALYKKALELACNAVAEWGAYAGEYFQEKWNWKADCKIETHLEAARNDHG